MPAHGVALRAALVRALLLAVVWWALAGGANGLGFAAVFVPLAVAVSLVLAPPGAPGFSLRGLLAFVPFFLWASLRGGIDVARRALDPRLPIAPALRVFALRVGDERQRVLVASVVSLMPGSVGAALEDGRLRLHVLDRRLANERVLRDVELHVAAIFGHRLEHDAPAAPRRKLGGRT